MTLPSDQSVVHSSEDEEEEDEEEEERARKIADVRAAAMAHGIGRAQGYGNGEHGPCVPNKLDEEDHNVVYMTNSWREWERHYLKKLAQRIHCMVCAELDNFEESLFMLFVRHDENLDGAVAGHEATDLLKAVEASVAPGAFTERGELMAHDGSITFIRLLDWYGGRESRDAPLPFAISSFAIGLVGSGSISNDARLETLSWRGLRRNVIGYRRLLSKIRQFQEERSLAEARKVERSAGLAEAMPAYYDVLTKEFDGDAEHLFELFCEVDKSGNMLLERNEVEMLLKLLDTSASHDDLGRYVAEINLDQRPLSFASLLDWWDQARSVPNSLVAEKGAALIASVKARAAQRRMSGYFFSERSAQAQWARATDDRRLGVLRQGYVRTIAEVRQYKLDRDLRAAEFECAQL